jgi:hypothetical protein
MAGYVGRLEPGDVLDARPYFAGPWRSFERARLDPGTSREFIADGVEFSIFATEGRGSYDVAGQRDDADVGTAITIGHGASVTITAGQTGIELFVTTVTVVPLD